MFSRFFISAAVCAAFFAAALAGGAANAQFSTVYELIKAVQEQKYEEVRTLMQRCRCPNARTAEDVPVLVVAAANNNVAIAGFLLDSGANPNAVSRTSRTSALMQFAGNGNEAGVRLLIGAGAQLDAADSVGETALMKAVRTRRPMVVRLLVEAGANTEMPDYQGRTALDIARSLRLRDMEQILVNAG